MARQVRVLNTNTRYLTDQSINYAERLKATLDPSLDTVIFVNSGSEANDVAWRMAKAWTGKTGGLVMDFAYHGVTDVIDCVFALQLSPASWQARIYGSWRHRTPTVGRSAAARQSGRNYAALADHADRRLQDSGFRCWRPA